ncbi:MAG: 3-dehydroquinate synthase [Spirochaetales bacterium]|nr:3-dehydroquinate synthase [Spirochaetales bacterium]
MREILNCLGTKVFMADDFTDLSYHVGTYGNKTLWVCDSNTAKMVRPLPSPNVILEAGESSKSFACLERIISVAMDNNLGRDCTFIALGGGMICDITAFAASIYMRGCKVILIPTTLVSMASSTLGGKTSINFRFAKDIVGTFFPANEVLICTDCLRSLTQKDYMNGFAEVLKHSLLTKDDELFNIVATQKQKILDRDSETLKQIITISLQIKKSYIDNDPYERLGLRAALNLGSTFAYALEGMSRLQWSSGQAVAWGVCKAMEASREMGICTKEFAAGVIKLFAFYGFDVNYRIQRGDWMDYRNQLAKNKKTMNGVVSFVLLKDQGEYEIRPIDEDIIKSVVMVPSV